jgi:hypothetical protein
MTTPQTLLTLASIMEENTWTQQDLSDSTGFTRSTIGHHLTATRPIRDEHIVAYIKAVPEADRTRLFAAWLRDLLAVHPELSETLLDSARTRISTETANWSPELTPEQRNWLTYWEHQMRIDPGAADFMELITQREQGRAGDSPVK